MRAAVYACNGETPPGRLCTVDLEVLDLGPNHLRLSDVTVHDESPEALFDGRDLVFDPAGGGGPMAGRAANREARAFALVNTAFHVQRALRFAAQCLERELPPLTVRIGLHLEHGSWGGGHYRLPATRYSELPESHAVSPSGEIHLGYGRRYLGSPAPQYFHAPGHNAGIIYHEVGHHICRHTADFRLNALLPPDRQTNRKVSLDEGSCDFISAALLDCPDLFGWHRAQVPEWQMNRRCLSNRWTMAHFHGGRRRDPHADGSIWASALWSARLAVARAGYPARRFDALFLRALDAFGRQRPAMRDEDELRRRRHFAGLLERIVACEPTLADPVLQAMAQHGIEPGLSNAELRDRARAPWLARSTA